MKNIKKKWKNKFEKIINILIETNKIKVLIEY